MNASDVPRIEFPCQYPIKIVGEFAADFRQMALEVMEHHAPELDQELVTERLSRNGRFISLTVTIVATGEPQLKALFEALKNTGRVQIVL